MRVYELSGDPVENGTDKIIIKSNFKETGYENFYFKIGTYVICSYNNSKYIGMIISKNDEFDDFEIDFLKPQGYSKYYYFPDIKDKCHISKEQILKILNYPNLNAGTTRIQYIFDENEITVLK